MYFPGASGAPLGWSQTYFLIELSGQEHHFGILTNQPWPRRLKHVTYTPTFDLVKWCRVQDWVTLLLVDLKLYCFISKFWGQVWISCVAQSQDNWWSSSFIGWKLTKFEQSSNRAIERSKWELNKDKELIISRAPDVRVMLTGPLSRIRQDASF